MASIEKLGAIMEMRVNPEYHALRIAELQLTADYQMKIQEERERAREERELLREQRRAEAELAAERERLEKERTHYLNALQALRAKGDDAAAEEIASRLTDIDDAIAANDFRIANIRAGYVYVISNIGAFGGSSKLAGTQLLHEYCTWRCWVTACGGVRVSARRGSPRLLRFWGLYQGLPDS